MHCYVVPSNVMEFLFFQVRLQNCFVKVRMLHIYVRTYVYVKQVQYSSKAT